MRWRGVNHVEFSVIDYEKSVEFYDKMFGWLGYKSFWTMDIGYHSTYYMARFPFPHSYIGIQPAKTGGKLDHEARATGIHHIAIWAKNRKEVDRFHSDFLTPNAVPVTEAPVEYPVYAPGYYAVFFDDPINGIHWELAHIPAIASPASYMRTIRAWKAAESQHPEWAESQSRKYFRKLPRT
ncbi:VOC family protein [Martelella mediterranea]|uniref:Catechol 2,3-dioxygenase-like lactoylglutathione lyase family enzyme n=1 Tax=Martelella mediterranea TaxID=293089 RepID=A0A4R3NYU0_9HYPH|nr:VOC family protein [Martelella mediterranea]TCT45130.1 catechol 2,3-dioxygenase-like lactoylglutathione lyase family enzyme [Martelella mediterranea]